MHRAGLVLAGALLGSACGDETDLAPCLEPVTYTADILPRVLAPYCSSCHASTLVAGQRQGAPVGLDFDDWASVEPEVARIANAITSGRMPPVGRARPDRSERALTERWRRCGFPR